MAVKQGWTREPCQDRKVAALRMLRLVLYVHILECHWRRRIILPGGFFGLSKHDGHKGCFNRLLPIKKQMSELVNKRDGVSYNNRVRVFLTIDRKGKFTCVDLQC